MWGESTLEQRVRLLAHGSGVPFIRSHQIVRDDDKMHTVRMLAYERCVVIARVLVLCGVAIWRA